MPFIVGLTGGIGSGKSTAAGIFAALGAAVVDTDDIAHALTGPGGARDARIRKEFGGGYMRSDGGLDRSRMREVVFADADARQRLEGILHPLIRFRRRSAWPVVRSLPTLSWWCPLLLETGTYLAARASGSGLDVAVTCRSAAPWNAQPPHPRGRCRHHGRPDRSRRSRLAAADDVIDNNRGEHFLRAQVERLHAAYVRLAARRGRSLKRWLRAAFSFIFARPDGHARPPSPLDMRTAVITYEYPSERARSDAVASRGSVAPGPLFRRRDGAS